jgi:hypothetical protein
LNARVFRLAALAVTLLVPAAGQVATLQIRFLAGDGGVHPPGRRAARPLTVEVTDEVGKPVPAAAVSFHLPEDGGGGAFANGMHTDISIADAQGRAVMRTIEVARTPGPFQIRIVAVKEQARAGAVSLQYVGEPTAAPRPRRTWIAVAVAVSGAAAAGALSAIRKSTPSATPSAPPVPPTPTISIGVPTTTVGRP